jgi:TIR domain
MSGQMAGRIFISYRREDSAGSAGRVHDRLLGEFGPDLLFMDVDAVPLGVNFVKALREEVAKCDVLLAVIGPNWVDIRDEHGNRRLDHPGDFVRVEIAAALQRDIPVIPILLDGSRIPKAEQLPAELQELSVRNGLDVRHASFRNDMDKLVRGLKKEADRSSEPPAPSAPPEQNKKLNLAEPLKREEAKISLSSSPLPSVRPSIVETQMLAGRIIVVGLIVFVLAFFIYKFLAN